MPDPRRATIAFLVALLAAGCAVRGPFGDKAGGVPGGKVVLTLATVSSQLQERPPVAYFIRRVEALSGGNIRIDVIYNWKSPRPNAEQQVVKATAAGKLDLGVVGSRVFDTMGVRSLQALIAPMLIDSYPLEHAVLDSGIAKHMLPGVARLNVTGLALVGNGLRKPVAVAHPLLGQKDWRGITFGTYLSRIEEETVHALGANQVVAFSSARNRLLQLKQLEGFEFNLLAYDINGYWAQARYVTANVVLWPQVDVLVANPGVLAQLTSQQRGWLEQAAREATRRSASMMEGVENKLLPTLCKNGTRFANASRADLTWLRRAFAQVYSRLKTDPQTKDFIAQIQSIKRRMAPAPPLSIPKSCLAR